MNSLHQYLNIKYIFCSVFHLVGVVNRGIKYFVKIIFEDVFLHFFSVLLHIVFLFDAIKVQPHLKLYFTKEHHFGF